ncbi:MAG: FAD-dependent oxidoreductase, partial [Oscillospiraceae bacterium]|nr:FAD-dependent oxidoreductase [Oscillospiraceae bacterium]
NVKIGQDVKLEQLQKEYDAVIVAAGAWTSTGLGCPGEDLDGVVGGIDFLREVALSDNAAPSLAGKKIAIVGGGNTAMDACRTAVRLGASEVYNIYRRTKNEMPAEAIEIQEAEEEGVIFKNLTNPIEIIGGDGKVKAVRLQIMELGEPDASGRRSPVAVAGAEETIEADMVIVAIGQKLNAFGLEALEQTRRGTIAADEHTFRTNLPGVFAVGDATNKGADIAISAIGEARNAAGIVDRYLNGAELAYEPPYLVKSEKTAADFAGREKAARVKMPHRCAGERKSDFLEINLGWSAEQAKREAARCLECGCPDYFECKLIDYANQYRVRPEKYAGKTHHREPLDDHPFIRRNPDKCILCGLCVRVCGEVVGAAALGLVDRGFDTVVKPALDMDLRETDCIACGQCVNICPTGALTETLMIAKQVPLKETVTETVCSFCSVGCKTKLSSAGNLLTRSVPDDLLCMKGRFGFGEIAKKSRLTTPLINPRRAGNSPRRAGNNGEPAGFEQAAGYVNENFRELQARFGSDCVAVTISDRYTNQEVFLIREYAQKVLKTDTVFSLGQTIGGIADVLGRDASTATFDGLENAGLIVAIGSGIVQNHGVAAMKIRRAVNKGAKLLMISPEESLLDDISALRIDPGDELAVLEQILRLLLDNGCGKGFAGYDELSDSLVNTVPGEEAQSAANMIGSIQKPLFVFERNTVTLQAARLIADMAVLSGGGLIQLLPGANSQGLLDLGARSGEELRRAVENGKIRGLFIFGEDAADLDYGKLDFLAVQELHMTATAQRAQVVFPASSFVEKSGSGAAAGSYTAADGRVQQLKPAVAGPVALDNAAQIKLLMTGIDFAEPDDSGQDEKCGGSIRLAPAKPDTLLRGGVEDTNTLRKSLMAFTAEKV